jgi:diguanylate cyclase (GGDEF)-like protein
MQHGQDGVWGEGIVRSTSAFRGFFARRPDPYAGGDLDNAQRISAVLWAMLVLLTLALLPASPPTQPSKGTGWAITGILLLLGALLVYENHRRRISSWSLLLATGYGIVAGIAVMQWLAGGLGQPYDRLLLLPVVFVAATQPPRQTLAFLVFVLLALLAPLFYDGWNADDAGAMLATFVIWCTLALGGNLLMSGVRAQRVSHAVEEAEARHEARIDALTGLPNRRAFDELLRSEVARARRLNLPLSVGMVDIENFKEVNDRWSYAEGDRCLQDVAGALRAALRQPDFCFRWGGDEFALILSGTPAAGTGPLAERLQAEVAATCRRPDKTPVQVRFAVAELDDEATPEELTEVAGLALTAVKVEASR